jgi:hypothetical protein
MPGLFRRHPAGGIQARDHRPQSRHQRAQRLRDAGTDRRRMRGCGNLHSAGGALPECNYGYRTLSEKKLAGILRTLPKRPLLAGDEGIRLSLASAQDKVGCASKDGEVSVPLGGAPSTHTDTSKRQDRPKLSIRLRGQLLQVSTARHHCKTTLNPRSRTLRIRAWAIDEFSEYPWSSFRLRSLSRSSSSRRNAFLSFHMQTNWPDSA